MSGENTQEVVQEASQILITFANKDSVSVEMVMRNVSAAQLLLAAIWMDRKARQIMDEAEAQRREQAAASTILMPKLRRVD